MGTFSCNTAKASNRLKVKNNTAFLIVWLAGFFVLESVICKSNSSSSFYVPYLDMGTEAGLLTGVAFL